MKSGVGLNGFGTFIGAVGGGTVATVGLARGRAEALIRYGGAPGPSR